MFPFASLRFLTVAARCGAVRVGKRWLAIRESRAPLDCDPLTRRRPPGLGLDLESTGGNFSQAPEPPPEFWPKLQLHYRTPRSPASQVEINRTRRTPKNEGGVNLHRKSLCHVFVCRSTRTGNRYSSGVGAEDRGRHGLRALPPSRLLRGADRAESAVALLSSGPRLCPG